MSTRGRDNMAEGQRQPKKSALLIGIDQYNCSGIRDLHGSIADVNFTEQFLQNIARIPAITKLISPSTSPSDPLPTFGNIVSAFKALADDAQPGDFIYIHYSGHGSRLPSRFTEIKGNTTCFDECLVLASEMRGRVDHLLDVEIAFLLKQIADKGATVTFILDCCHSGGATRDGDDDDEGVRGFDDIPDESFSDLTRAPISESTEDLGKAWGLPSDYGDDAGRAGTVLEHWMTAAKRINFLAACQPSEKAQEIPRRQTAKRGLFTDCLVNVIRENGGPGAGRLGQLSCDVVYNLVSDKLQNHRLKDQSKQQNVVFGGQGDCHFFGAESVVQPAVVVNSVEALTTGRLKLELSAGVAHGVRVNDFFAIYPIGKQLSTLVDYSAPLATCSVTAVENFACNAHILSDAANHEHVTVGCVAVSLRDILRQHVLKPKGVSVSAANDSEELVKMAQDVRDCISCMSKLVQLDDSGETFFKVVVGDGSPETTISFTPDQEEAQIEVAGEVQDIVSRLGHLTIFYNLFNLSKHREQGRGLAVEKLGYLDRDAEIPESEPYMLSNPPPPTPGLRNLLEGSIDLIDGQILKIDVRNASLEHLYVEIIDLEPCWKATVEYPRPNAMPIQIPPNEGRYFYIQMSQSDKVPYSIQPHTFDRFLVLATPRARRNFPQEILPSLGQTLPPVLDIDNGDDLRAGRGVDQPSWFVQHLDVRVVPEQ